MAIRNLRQFEARLRRAERLPEEVVERTQRAATLELHGSLVLATPVDKGRARGNWQVSQGAPPGDVVGPAEFPGDSGAARGAAATRAAQQQALQELPKVRAFSRTYVSNRLPYIVRLNDGWSRQAPAGFVQVAVNRIRRLFGRR